MHNPKQYLTASISIAILSIVILIWFAYSTSTRSRIPPVFSDREMLYSLWQEYKTNHIEPETFRTFDKSRNYITTSEGESYTMLRAVWTDDREMFDRSFSWTKDNLKRPNDNLFAWLFGARPDGTYGILTAQGGGNTASDANIDIALALVFAYSRWQDESYLVEALPIIRDIWQHEVVIIKGRPYLAANNLEKTSDSDYVLLNPSYFAPYAFRIFSSLDHEHNWIELVDTSYEVLDLSMSLPLDKTESAGLPPDWVRIHRRTADIQAPAGGELTSNYGFDAMRVPWRLGLDYVWYKEKRAKILLEKMSFLGAEWKNGSRLHSTYAHDGSIVHAGEAPAMYGGAMGYFIGTNNDSKRVYETKLLTLYSPDNDGWKTPLGYYDDNLAWFGMALYNNMLENLYLLNFKSNSL